jgi:hypothetical protein
VGDEAQDLRDFGFERTGFGGSIHGNQWSKSMDRAWPARPSRRTGNPGIGDAAALSQAAERPILMIQR